MKKYKIKFTYQRDIASNNQLNVRKNVLNELPANEWMKFLKSWFILNPRPRAKEVLTHPAKFPEELILQFLKFFTKTGDTVLDPMVGTGSTLMACIQSGRNGIGIELNKKYVNIARERLNKLNTANLPFTKPIELNIKLILGNANNIEKMKLPMVDYIITSPPYWNMLKRSSLKGKKRKEKNFDIWYSNDPKDIGNIDSYEEFLDAIENIYTKVITFLKPGKYMTIIVKNINRGNKMYPLAWDIGKRLGKHLILKGEKIWCQDNVKILPYGYGNSLVTAVVHQYCLNFQKSKTDV